MSIWPETALRQRGSCRVHPVPRPDIQLSSNHALDRAGRGCRVGGRPFIWQRSVQIDFQTRGGM